MHSASHSTSHSASKCGPQRASRTVRLIQHKVEAEQLVRGGTRLHHVAHRTHRRAHRREHLRHYARKDGRAFGDAELRLQRYALLITCVLLTTHYSLLTTHYSLLTTHHSPLTAAYKPSGRLQVLLHLHTRPHVALDVSVGPVLAALLLNALVREMHS